MVIMKRFSFFVLYSTLFAIPLHAQVIAPSLTGRAGGESGSVLTGTTLNQRVPAKTAAVLKAGTDGLGFYPITSTTSVKANTAYLPENKQLLIDIATLDSPLTGIEAPRYPSEGDEIVNRSSSNGKCYDISGREMAKGRSAKGDASRLKKLPRGIYVTNKQKFVVQP